MLVNPAQMSCEEGLQRSDDGEVVDEEFGNLWRGKVHNRRPMTTCSGRLEVRSEKKYSAVGYEEISRTGAVAVTIPHDF